MIIFKNTLPTILFTLLCLFVFSSSLAFAYDPINNNNICDAAATNNGGTKPEVCNTSSDDPLTRSGGKEGIIFKAVRLVSMGVAIMSVIMIILAGFTYITSNGDPQKISAAKDTIVYAIIGLLVAVSAQVILVTILKNI